MAIIYSYPTVTPELQDLLLGVEITAPGQNKPKSRNFTISSIIDLINIPSILGYIPANDANVVHKTGNETINGLKIFNEHITTTSILSTSGQLFLGAGGTNLTISDDNEQIIAGREFIAPSLRIPGGTSTQFLKANGSIDNNTYAIDSTVVHKTGDETINGFKSFNLTPRFNSGSINIFDDPASGYASINVADSIFTIIDSNNKSQFSIETGFGFAVYKTNTIAANIAVATLTQSRNYTLPNESGTFALRSDITVPTLQQVTDFGDTTSNDISANSLSIYDSPNGEHCKIAINDSYFTISRSNGAFTSMLSTENGDNLILTNTTGASAQITNNLLVSRNYTLPNANGTIALDENLVHKTGNETIDGIKTFNKDLLVNGITIGKGNGNFPSNTVVGNDSLLSNLIGIQNTAIGDLSLNANTANNNTAIGFKAMQLNGVGNTNTSVGSESLSSNLGGNENSAFGYRALQLSSSALRNNAFGRFALGNILTGNQNVGIGVSAGALTELGQPNTASFFSVYVGNDTKSFANNSQNEIVIGYNATGIGSNSVVLGNSSIINTILRGQTLIGTTETATPTFGLAPQLVVTKILSGGIGVPGVVDLRNLDSNIVANTVLGRIQFTGKGDGGGSGIGYTSSAIEGIAAGSAGGGSSGGGILKFMTSVGGTGASPVERMRITNTGILQPGVDNSYSLGASGIRWSSVWAVNGAIQTSDEREKKDIIDSDLGLDFISKLRPVSFKWKVGKNEVTSELDGLDEEGNPKTKTIVTTVEGKRTHYGLIAQEVEQLLDGKDFGGFIHDKETDIKGLRYDQFIPVLINAIKELKAEIEILKNS